MGGYSLSAVLMVKLMYDLLLFVFPQPEILKCVSQFPGKYSS